MTLEILKTVLFIIGGVTLIFSKKLTVNIIVGILMIIFIVLEEIKNYNKNKNIIIELKNKNQTSKIYKEKLMSTIFFPLFMTINSILILEDKVSSKNINLIRNNEKEISGILEFIKTGTSKELAAMVTWIVILVISIAKLILYINRNVILSDKELIFSDGTTINLNKIVYVEYIHQYFPSNKKKILKIKTNILTKKIVVDINDDKLKTYIENNINID